MKNAITDSVIQAQYLGVISESSVSFHVGDSGLGQTMLVINFDCSTLASPIVLQTTSRKQSTKQLHNSSFLPSVIIMPFFSFCKCLASSSKLKAL